jgi:hypothetical protein
MVALVLAVIGALAVFAFLAIQGWWLVFAIAAVLCLWSGFMAWRAGLPWLPGRSGRDEPPA